MNPTDETWIARARELGILPAGHFRALVLESDLRVTHLDSASFEEARTYAADAASEDEENAVLSWVFNDRFEIVYKGRHYAVDA